MLLLMTVCMRNSSRCACTHSPLVCSKFTPESRLTDHLSGEAAARRSSYGFLDTSQASLFPFWLATTEVGLHITKRCQLTSVATTQYICDLEARLDDGASPSGVDLCFLVSHSTTRYDRLSFVSITMIIKNVV